MSSGVSGGRARPTLRIWLVLALVAVLPLVMADDCNLGSGTSSFNTDLSTKEGQQNVGALVIILVLCAIDSWEPQPAPAPMSFHPPPDSIWVKDPSYRKALEDMQRADDMYRTQYLQEQRRAEKAQAEGVLACVR